MNETPDITAADPATRVHHHSLARLQQIHEAISSGGFPTIARLAEITGLSTRTIKRNLAALRDSFKAPLEYVPKRRGWHYTQPGWQLPPVHFSEGELLAFFTAEHALRSLGHTPEAEILRRALSKLAAHLPDRVSVNPQELGKLLSFEAAPHVSVEPQTLKTLAHAAREQRTVAFDYYSPHSNQKTRRTADVLLLRHFAGDWYAVSYDHQRRALRDFNAGRIRNLRDTGRPFTPPAGWDPDEYLRTGFSMMRGGEIVTVKLVFDEYQSRWLRAQSKRHPDEQREELAGGRLRLTFPVGRNGLEAVARFCLTYAGHCKIEEPVELCEIFRQKLHLAIEQHSE
jgi:predicted DNA-binding transcriptional regulator YafY